MGDFAAAIAVMLRLTAIVLLAMLSAWEGSRELVVVPPETLVLASGSHVDEGRAVWNGDRWGVTRATNEGFWGHGDRSDAISALCETRY
jgi:hypothetical protein